MSSQVFFPETNPSSVSMNFEKNDRNDHGVISRDVLNPGKGGDSLVPE